MTKYRSNETVLAEKIEDTQTVVTWNGPVTVNPGDIVVTNPDTGEVTIVDDETFTGRWGVEKPQRITALVRTDRGVSVKYGDHSQWYSEDQWSKLIGGLSGSLFDGADGSEPEPEPETTPEDEEPDDAPEHLTQTIGSVVSSQAPGGFTLR